VITNINYDRTTFIVQATGEIWVDVTKVKTLVRLIL